MNQNAAAQGKPLQPEAGVHWSTCKMCSAYPIRGTLFSCQTCPDFDVCKPCNQQRIAAQQHMHYFDFFVLPRPGKGVMPPPEQAAQLLAQSRGAPGPAYGSQAVQQVVMGQQPGVGQQGRDAQKQQQWTPPPPPPGPPPAQQQWVAPVVAPVAAVAAVETATQPEPEYSFAAPPQQEEQKQGRFSRFLSALAGDNNANNSNSENQSSESGHSGWSSFLRRDSNSGEQGQSHSWFSNQRRDSDSNGQSSGWFGNHDNNNNASSHSGWGGDSSWNHQSHDNSYSNTQSYDNSYSNTQSYDNSYSNNNYSSWD